MLLKIFSKNKNVLLQIVMVGISQFKNSIKLSGLARNRTWIWSFGNSYTIHCTTRPFVFYRNRAILNTNYGIVEMAGKIVAGKEGLFSFAKPCPYPAQCFYGHSQETGNIF